MWGPCADMCFNQPRPYVRGRPGSSAAAPSEGRPACSHTGRVSRGTNDKANPTHIHTHTHPASFPRRGDSAPTNRRGRGGACTVPPLACVTRGAAPRVRATPRGAARGVCGGVAGLHVRRFAHAEASVCASLPRSLSVTVCLFSPLALWLTGADKTAKGKRDAQRGKALAAKSDGRVRTQKSTWWTDGTNSYKLPPGLPHVRPHKHSY